MDSEVLGISISGDIGADKGFGDSYSIERFKKDLSKNPNAKIVNLHIASNGGDVFTGYDIGNLIKDERAKGKKFVAIVGSRAASIATYIAACCDEINAYSNSKWLIHVPRNEGAGGTAAQLAAHAQVLMHMEDDLVNQYKAKSGQDETSIRALMAKDTFITAQQALELGYIDKIIEAINADIDTDFKAVATYNHLKDNTMQDNKEVAKGIFAQLKEFFKADATNVIEVQGDVKVGAPVMMDGAPAPDGEHKMSDGSILVVKDGKIESIKEATAAVDTKALQDEIANLKSQLATAKAEQETAVAKVAELTALNTTVTAKETEANAIVASLKDKFQKWDAALAKTLPVASYKAITGVDNEPNNSKAAKDEKAEVATGFLARLKKK